MFFLCILFLPVFAFAENIPLPADKIQGFDSTLVNNVINYSGGSGYDVKDTYTYGGIAGPMVSGFKTEDGKSKNLFSSSQPEINVSPEKLLALKTKLEKSGSAINIKNFTVNNVYTINTENTSVFVYDPTPNSPANRDEVIVAVATKKGDFLALKSQIRKEIEGRPDEDNIKARGNDGDGFINLADSIQGLEIGTSLGIKNDIDNKTQIKINANKELEEAEKKLKEATEASDKNPSDVKLKEAKDTATNVRDQLKAKADLADANLKTAEANRANSAPTQSVNKCDNWLSFISLDCYMQKTAIAANFILKIVSFITYVVGRLFDYSLELSINSAQFLSELGVIEIAWTFIRDVLNMTFIFILLWTAIQILLGNDTKYNAKRILIGVVLVAILMNFSLFGAKLMVDGSNIVTLKLYESMKSGGVEGGPKASISQRVMTAVGMTTLYNIKDVFGAGKLAGDVTCGDKDGTIILISVMGSIFMLILCLALGLAGILFLIRLVNIIILFIKSPLFVWGFILPGSGTITELKNKWWKEMRHVLIFPIMYMFWMYVAVLIFTKLGETNKQSGTSLIRLICGGSTDTLGNSISVVAVFAIVIIFLMKTIEYGFTHIGDGGDGAIGNKFGKSMGEKFSGYQTALTKGLMKKAGQGTMAVGGAVGGASIGAARGSLKLVPRAGGAGIGLVSAMKKGDNWWEGTKSGFFDPGIATKSALRDVSRKVAASTANNTLANLLQITSGAAKLANKYDDPKNSDGKTKKEMDQARTAKAAEDEKLRYDAINKQYAVLSKKDWDKKNPGGTLADYEKHIVDTMTLRTDALLGKGVSGQLGKSGTKTHIEELKEKAIIREKDAAGNLTGVVKFNEYAMHNALPDIIEHHTTGPGKSIDKTKFTTFRNIKAKARIKAISDKVKDNKSKAFDKKHMEDQKVDYQKAIEKIQEKITTYPDDIKINGFCSSYTVYSGDGDNVDSMKKLNKAIINYNSVNSVPSPNPTMLAKAQKDIDDAQKKYVEYYNKQKSELIKAEDRYNQQLKKIEEAENKK